MYSEPKPEEPENRDGKSAGVWPPPIEDFGVHIGTPPKSKMNLLAFGRNLVVFVVSVVTGLVTPVFLAILNYEINSLVEGDHSVSSLELIQLDGFGFWDMTFIGLIMFALVCAIAFRRQLQSASWGIGIGTIITFAFIEIVSHLP